MRDFSTSESVTGAKWTIQFRNPPTFVRGKDLELKFK